MIAQVEFEYSSGPRFAELAKDEETYVKLRSILPNAPSPENRDKEYYWDRTGLIDLETDGRWLVEQGISFIVKKFKGTMPLQTILPDGKMYTVYVQVPHIGLLLINEVEVLEDACTDRLQTKLDAGWRILCVCPPNAARRPDYVLGRTRDVS